MHLTHRTAPRAEKRHPKQNKKEEHDLGALPADSAPGAICVAAALVYATLLARVWVCFGLAKASRELPRAPWPGSSTAVVLDVGRAGFQRCLPVAKTLHLRHTALCSSHQNHCMELAKHRA